VLEVDAAFRALHSAVDTFVAAAADRYGVNRNDQHCLELLDRRGPLTAGELAEASGLSAAAVTKVVDRLLAAGYVRRTRAENDRRRVIIATTDAEQRLAREVFGPLVADGIRMLSELTDEQLQMLRDLLLRSAELNMKHTERLRRSAGEQR
jgi:DNA-binding MarR family transcriptional regulator